MALTEVQLANMAMARIGHTVPLTTAGATIEGLDPQLSLENQVVQTFYTNALTSVLRDHPWNFALRIDSLVLILKDDGLRSWSGRWIYQYRYPITPALLIRAVRFPGEARDNPYPNKFEVSSFDVDRAIFTNVGTSDEGGAICDFTFQPAADIYSDDSKFVTAFTSLLGFEIAPALLADAGRAQLAYQLYRTALLSAQRSDANEDERGEDSDGSFVTLHRSG